MAMHDDHAKGSTGLNPREWNALIGIITAIVGNILISFALNIQRYAHIRLNKDHLRRRKSWKSARRRKKSAAIKSYGTQLDIAEQRAEANRTAPRLDEEDREHQERYHDNRVDGEEADERAPLNGRSTSRSSSSATVGPSKDNDDDDAGDEKKSYLKSPYWWLGIILMTTGEAGNFIAYGFAPASIVSPLGVVALISNCIVAPLLLKEHFRQRDFWGVLIAIGGAVTVVLSASMTDPKLGPKDIWKSITRWEFELYLGITAGLIIILMWASGRYGDRSILIDIGLVGLFGGYTALSTKGVASLLTDTIWRAVTFPIFYLLVFILVVTAVFQIRYVNRALARFDSTRVVPTQFVSFTISVIVGSAILYREFESTTGDKAGKFVGGCVMTFLGVYLITSGKRDNGSDEDFDVEEDEPEAIHLVDEEQGLDSVESADGYPIKQKSRIASLKEDETPRNSPPMAEFQTGSQQQSLTPQRTLTSRSDASVPFSIASGVSPLSDNPWDKPSAKQDHVNLPHATSSTPILPLDPNELRPTSPTPNPNSSRTNVSRVSTISRSSMSHLIPGPISSPLSSSLSAIVADQIRRGVEVTPRKKGTGTLRRMRSNLLDAEDTQSAESPSRLQNTKSRTRSGSGTLAGLFKLQRSKSDKSGAESGQKSANPEDAGMTNNYSADDI